MVKTLRNAGLVGLVLLSMSACGQSNIYKPSEATDRFVDHSSQVVELTKGTEVILKAGSHGYYSPEYPANEEIGRQGFNPIRNDEYFIPDKNLNCNIQPAGAAAEGTLGSQYEVNGMYRLVCGKFGLDKAWFSPSDFRPVMK